jgi:hypothetical protein
MRKSWIYWESILPQETLLVDEHPAALDHWKYPQLRVCLTMHPNAPEVKKMSDIIE